MNAPDNLKRHKLSAYFGDMPANEHADLVIDIDKHGVLQPVVVQDGEVLDGWGRYTAAREVGKPCPMVSFDSLGLAMRPEDFVASQNFYRRHLSLVQRAAMAIEIFGDRMLTKDEAIRKAINVRLHVEDKILSDKLTNRQVAKIARVDINTLVQVKRLKRQRPDLYEKAKQGEVKTPRLQQVKSTRSKSAIEKARRELEKHRTAIRCITGPISDLADDGAALTPREFAEHLQALRADPHGKETISYIMENLQTAVKLLTKCLAACRKK